MAKAKNEQPADGAGKETEALQVQGASDILALSADGAAEFNQIIQENFGGSRLTLADLDKIKIPSGQGAAVWSIPSAIEGDEDTTKELAGILIGWADKKSWWHKTFNESGGKEQPDCKSNDMVHGLGNPNMILNQKEQALVAEGKANAQARAVVIPDTDGQKGYLCATCPHNVFGSAAQGGGKSCQDKRFILMMLKDSVMPILIRVPATSINNIKQYFKRLAGSRTSYLGVLTAFTLLKVEGKIPYYTIVPKAVRKLTPEETAQVRSLRVPFQEALDAEDAVEQGYIEKDVASESLDDMPTHSGGEQEAPAAAPEGDDPF